ncbi:helix-turn-helix domain-containing protein [Thiothrix fructosivorans]|jgi:transcriptional regulator with XRE-family HTH domain|uniref:Helix-turn-helix transcriptional regulator n=1 Tax=Thiothrix fructosivorans TaxID=111770 RepID=A0A8B0SLC6_9GAMM|nr:helix-turn-helix transcriptional regulator [Thiothrix fructosivorans]MBO0611818.1 helix-turn-helix transcriptional regulator [Thiothrix fructosivorans]QTX10527.1 helix-turn-helix transcriptional regulator [Thiothrix fructosivorans]
MQADTPNRHIPQDGKRLKALRKIKGLSQAGLAQALQALIKPYMKTGFVIQQPDIARIELEKSTLDVPELLGYSQFFGTDIDDLLKPHFRSLHKNAFCLQQFSTDSDADDYFTQMEAAGRILAYSHFPSSFFMGNQPTNRRFQQISQTDYCETHLHTLDSLLSFIFSPISRYSYAQRNSILERYLEHFRQRHNKHLYFFSRANFPPHSLFPNLVLLPEKATLLMLAPIMQQQQGDIFLEIHDEPICKQVYNFYFQTVPLLEASMPLLRIGRETLALLQAGVSMENAIRYFYDEVQKRSPEDAEAVLQNVGQDMQDILIE